MGAKLHGGIGCTNIACVVNRFVIELYNCYCNLVIDTYISTLLLYWCKCSLVGKHVYFCIL